LARPRRRRETEKKKKKKAQKYPNPDELYFPLPDQKERGCAHGCPVSTEIKIDVEKY